MKRFCLALLFVSCLSAAACGKPATPQLQSVKATDPAAQITLPEGAEGVKTMVVQSGAVPDFLEIPAKIQPDPQRVVRIYPPVGGRLINVEVKPGDVVRRGQMLALLDSSDVASARSDYEKAQADELLKEKARNRAAELLEHKAISEKDFEQSTADLQMARSDLERTLERLRLLGLDPNSRSDRLGVRAPRGGVVLDIGASQGELSKSLDSPAPLCTLADLNVVWVVGEVYEKDLASVTPGAAAEVTLPAYPDEKVEGRIEKIMDVVDPATRTLKVRVVLDNRAGRLKPEMFATLRINRPGHKGLLVPSTAMLRQGNTDYVFVETQMNHFDRRPVTITRSFDSQVEINSGLKPGERVVVEGALLLRSAAAGS